MDAIFDAFGSLFGSLVPMFIALGVCVLVLVGYILVAVKAATENIDLIKWPVLPFVVVYFIAIDLPLLGGDDLFNMTGTYASNEILKMVLLGLPFFFFITWRLMGKGVPMAWALIYSAACWAGGLAAALGVITMIVIVGLFIISIVGGGSLLKGATEQGPVTMRRCPNCKQGIPIGESYCPHCGIEVG